MNKDPVARFRLDYALPPEDYYQTYKDIVIKMQKNQWITFQKGFDPKNYVRFIVDLDSTSPCLYAPLDAILGDVIQHYSPFTLRVTKLLILESYTEFKYKELKPQHLKCKIRDLIKEGFLYQDFYLLIHHKSTFEENRKYLKINPKLRSNLCLKLRSDKFVLERYHEKYLKSAGTQIKCY